MEYIICGVWNYKTGAEDERFGDFDAFGGPVDKQELLDLFKKIEQETGCKGVVMYGEVPDMQFVCYDDAEEPVVVVDFYGVHSFGTEKEIKEDLGTDEEGYLQ